MSKLTIFALGGAGINMANAMYDNLDNLTTGYANIEFIPIDTTTANIDIACKPLQNNFVRLTTNLDGRGGERKDIEASNILKEAISKFVIKQNLNDSKDNFYMVMFSGAGGTGSVAGIHLISELLTRNLSTGVIMVSANNDLLRLNNSYKTLAGINARAVSLGKALPIIYFSNTIDNITNKSTETIVNSYIESTLIVFASLISGNVQNIDMQDCINFIHPTNYKTFSVKPGAYELIIVTGDILDKDIMLTLTLSTKDADTFVTEVDLDSSKIGYLSDEMIDSDVYAEGIIHMAIMKNTMQREIKTLGQKLKSLEESRDSELDDTGVELDGEELFL